MTWIRSSRCDSSQCVEVAIITGVDETWSKSSTCETAQCVEVAWHKSSLSGPWTDNCVEVGVWNKSSFSNNGGQCVDVSGTDTQILVRDSKDVDGPVLTFSFEEWRAFLGGVRLGEFDIKETADVT